MHLNHVGNVNDGISSEEHFENSKTLEELIYLLIFVQIFEFYFVTKSL